MAIAGMIGRNLTATGTTAISLDCCRNTDNFSYCYHSTVDFDRKTVGYCSDRSTAIIVETSHSKSCFGHMLLAAFVWYFCDQSHPS